MGSKYQARILTRQRPCPIAKRAGSDGKQHGTPSQQGWLSKGSAGCESSQGRLYMLTSYRQAKRSVPTDFEKLSPFGICISVGHRLDGSRGTWKRYETLDRYDDRLCYFILEFLALRLGHLFLVHPDEKGSRDNIVDGNSGTD